jgi:predicted glycosyltransferase
VIAAVKELNKYGKVLISAEGELPIELEKNRVTVSPELVHHLLYFAKLVIGESATMASESSTLGTPAIYISTSTRGYTNEQEEKYGLVNTYSDPATAQRDGLAKALEILREGKPAEYWQEKRKALLADKIDVTEYVVNKIDYFGHR